MMDADRRMISPSFVEEALDCLRRAGKPTAPLLASLGLPLVVEKPISAESYGALWLAVAAEVDDEFFGMGERPMRRGSFTLLCHCVLHAKTLDQALRRALRFLGVVLEDPSGELVIRDGLAEIVLTDKGEARSAFAYRTYWILLHGITCWLVGRRIPIRRVDFRCAEPLEGADYRLFFGAPVQFSQPVSRLAFDRAVLKLPIVRTEQALKQFLRGAPANILVRYRYDAGLAAAVRKRLRQQAPAAWSGFDDLAAQMHMSPSTLRHRLQAEGQSYAGIKDEIRRDRAVEMLQSSDASVGDIAAQLGYSEPSAFHRAFRKWTTKSPAAFRRQATASAVK
ncbi:AraC family transcriptional regulator [Rhizobium sp. Root73]|uniref:AraC family transcriptional regulator n=1 Tax=unclassified Rhizobium TaxID=2613769 RepID=UPI000727DF97|nr:MULTISPECIES: AraC family transcriptional regulator [unclassified Rhizobium]KQY16380.1 AraC family transcriptional regulator [Rhizobium sp. Root1334]KRC12755.1 AraC family transcriptional regulator [Rhizobium sp. Root73]